MGEGGVGGWEGRGPGNTAGHVEAYRDAIHEDQVRVKGALKASSSFSSSERIRFSASRFSSAFGK